MMEIIDESEPLHPLFKKVSLPFWEVFGFDNKKTFWCASPQIAGSTASYFCKVMVTNSLRLPTLFLSDTSAKKRENTKDHFDWLHYFYRDHNNSIIMIYFTLDNCVMKILYHHSFNLNSIAITNLSLKSLLNNLNTYAGTSLPCRGVSPSMSRLREESKLWRPCCGASCDRCPREVCSAWARIGLTVDESTTGRK